MKDKYCWITLLATDNFCGGVKMLNDSLKKVNSKYQLHVIATNNLAQSSFEFLKRENIPYHIFPYISFFCNNDRNLKYWGNKINQNENIRWNCTFAKIYMFLFTDYDKVCFVDADIEFLENCDNYFDFPTPAAFNSPWIEGMCGGTIVITPNKEDFFKCLKIGCEPGVVNDEMIWYKWNPNFKNNSEHFLPTSDFYSDFERKFIHWDGEDKPWFE